MSFDPVRLRNLLSLMSSAADGEALAAARAATRYIQQAGLSWEDLIVPPPGITGGPVQTIRDKLGESIAPPLGRTWGETLRFLCAKRAGRNASENRMLDRLAADAARRPNDVVVSARQARIIVAVYRHLTGEQTP